MHRLIHFGLRETFRGLRIGNAPLSALGAFALGYGLVRRFARPRPQTLYSTTLKPGQSIRIGVGRTGDAGLETAD